MLAFGFAVSVSGSNLEITAPTRPVGIKGEIQMGAMGGIGVVLALLAIVVGVLWILLPFAVFGIKDLARGLILKQETTNQLLKQIIDQNEKKG